MKRPHNACAGCVHWRCCGKDSLKCCNYCIDTGKLRLVPPEECTHWENEKKAIAKTDYVKLAARFRELYDAGQNDMQIARTVGRSAYMVMMWRRKNNLPAIGRPGRRKEEL